MFYTNNRSHIIVVYLAQGGDRAIIIIFTHAFEVCSQCVCTCPLVAFFTVTATVWKHEGWGPQP